MDSAESPLDVLSRAATMVSPPTYGKQFKNIFISNNHSKKKGFPSL